MTLLFLLTGYYEPRTITPKYVDTGLWLDEEYTLLLWELLMDEIV